MVKGDELRKGTNVGRITERITKKKFIFPKKKKKFDSRAEILHHRVDRLISVQAHSPSLWPEHPLIRPHSGINALHVAREPPYPSLNAFTGFALAATTV